MLQYWIVAVAVILYGICTTLVWPAITLELDPENLHHLPYVVFTLRCTSWATGMIYAWIYAMWKNQNAEKTAKAMLIVSSIVGIIGSFSLLGLEVTHIYIHQILLGVVAGLSESSFDHLLRHLGKNAVTGSSRIQALKALTTGLTYFFGLGLGLKTTAIICGTIYIVIFVLIIFLRLPSDRLVEAGVHQTTTPPPPLWGTAIGIAGAGLLTIIVQITGNHLFPVLYEASVAGIILGVTAIGGGLLQAMLSEILAKRGWLNPLFLSSARLAQVCALILLIFMRDSAWWVVAFLWMVAATNNSFMRHALNAHAKLKGAQIMSVTSNLAGLLTSIVLLYILEPVRIWPLVVMTLASIMLTAWMWKQHRI